jgi:hypothetical protein
MNLLSIRRNRSPSYQAVILALLLALVGVATALYLTLA